MLSTSRWIGGWRRFPWSRQNQALACGTVIRGSMVYFCAAPPDRNGGETAVKRHD